MLKWRFENIVTYLRHRITNASSESINAKIQRAKCTAGGCRNKQNFVHAIYFEGVGFGGSVCFRKRVLLGCHRQNRDKTLALSSLGFVSNEKQIPQAIEKLKRGDVSKETLETIELRPRHVRS
jgi:hypothetical protein